METITLDLIQYNEWERSRQREHCAHEEGKKEIKELKKKLGCRTIAARNVVEKLQKENGTLKDENNKWIESALYQSRPSPESNTSAINYYLKEIKELKEENLKLQHDHERPMLAYKTFHSADSEEYIGWVKGCKIYEELHDKMKEAHDKMKEALHQSSLWRLQTLAHSQSCDKLKEKNIALESLNETIKNNSIQFQIELKELEEEYDEYQNASIHEDDDDAKGYEDLSSFVTLKQEYRDLEDENQKLKKDNKNYKINEELREMKIHEMSKMKIAEVEDEDELTEEVGAFCPHCDWEGKCLVSKARAKELKEKEENEDIGENDFCGCNHSDSDDEDA